MFRQKKIPFLKLSIAAAPLFSLCQKHSCLFKAPPPPDKAQSAPFTADVWFFNFVEILNTQKTH